MSTDPRGSGDIAFLVSQNDQLRIEIARLTAELFTCQQQLGECSGGYETLEREVASLRAELKEARRIVQALECLFSPYATDSTQRDWMDRAAAMTKEKPHGSL